MVLERLRLVHYRNFADVEIEFGPFINYIVGRNAQGKTTLLEAIYSLALSRSFRTVNDAHVVQIGQENFEVHGSFRTEYGVQHTVSIVYSGRRKQIRHNYKRLGKHSSLLGLAPMVLFSPEDHRITSGPPAERRNFLDIVLSQSDASYLKTLQEYSQVLRQRNQLLQLIADRHKKEDELEPWNVSLAQLAVQIIEKRLEFIKSIADELADVYRMISRKKDALTVRYACAYSMQRLNPDDFLNRLNLLREKEILRRQTLVGPHRDDVSFHVGDRDVKLYASRGEQKSVLLSLKIVEFNYLKLRKETTPIFLLDDFHSELDLNRQVNLISKIADLGQSFITSTVEAKNFPGNYRGFRVEDAKVELI